MMRESFVRTNSFNWIDHLSEYCDNRNNSKHSVTKHRPNEIYSSTRTKIANKEVDEEVIEKTDNDKQVLVKNKLEKYAQKALDRNIAFIYESGDLVRIYLPSIDTKLRKLIKSGDSKKIVVKYSKEVYIIDKVIKTRKDVFQKTKYTLIDSDGDVVMNEKGKPLRLYATDLQKIDKDTKPIKVNEEKLNEIVEEDIQKIPKRPMKNDTDISNVVEGKRSRTKKVIVDV
jgi:hypothetical protein